MSIQLSSKSSKALAPLQPLAPNEQHPENVAAAETPLFASVIAQVASGKTPKPARPMAATVINAQECSASALKLGSTPAQSPHPRAVQHGHSESSEPAALPLEDDPKPVSSRESHVPGAVAVGIRQSLAPQVKRVTTGAVSATRPTTEPARPLGEQSGSLRLHSAQRNKSPAMPLPSRALPQPGEAALNGRFARDASGQANVPNQPWASSAPPLVAAPEGAPPQESQSHFTKPVPVGDLARNVLADDEIAPVRPNLTSSSQRAETLVETAMATPPEAAGIHSTSVPRLPSFVESLTSPPQADSSTGGPAVDLTRPVGSVVSQEARPPRPDAPALASAKPTPPHLVDLVELRSERGTPVAGSAPGEQPQVASSPIPSFIGNPQQRLDPVPDQSTAVVNFGIPGSKNFTPVAVESPQPLQARTTPREIAGGPTPPVVAISRNAARQSQNLELGSEKGGMAAAMNSDPQAIEVAPGEQLNPVESLPSSNQVSSAASLIFGKPSSGANRLTAKRGTAIEPGRQVIGAGHPRATLTRSSSGSSTDAKPAKTSHRETIDGAGSDNTVRQLSQNAYGPLKNSNTEVRVASAREAKSVVGSTAESSPVVSELSSGSPTSPRAALADSATVGSTDPDVRSQGRQRTAPTPPRSSTIDLQPPTEVRRSVALDFSPRQQETMPVALPEAGVATDVSPSQPIPSPATVAAEHSQSVPLVAELRDQNAPAPGKVPHSFLDRQPGPAQLSGAILDTDHSARSDVPRQPPASPADAQRSEPAEPMAITAFFQPLARDAQFSAEPAVGLNNSPDQHASVEVPSDASFRLGSDPGAQRMAGKTEATAGMPAPAGISAAQTHSQMKFRDKADEIAGSTEQALPSRQSTVLVDSADAESTATEVKRPARAAHAPMAAPAMNLDQFQAASPVRTEPLELDTADAPEPNRLLHLMQSEVQLLPKTGTDHVSVVLRPDADTQILLHVRARDGVVEMQARCERGNMEALNAQWPQLQQSLSSQGIRLAPLHASAEPASARSTDQLGSGPSSQDQRSPRPSSELAGGELSGAPVRPNKSVRESSRAQRGSSEAAVEFWA